MQHISGTFILEFKRTSKQLLRFAIPIVGQRSVVVINGFISMLLIAQLGRNELAAGALVASIYTMLNVIATSIMYSVGIVISKAFGKNAHLEVGQIFRSGWVLAIIIAIPLILIMWNIGLILTFFHQPTNLVKLTQTYFRALTWGVIPLLFLTCSSQFFIGISKPKITLIFSAMSVLVVNVPGYILIFGKLGLPALGISGMAWAITIKNFLMILLVIFLIFLGNFHKKYNIFSCNFKQLSLYLKQLLRLGAPICLQYTAELTAVAASTFLMGLLGAQALAAQQITMQLTILATMVPFALAQATAILIGQSLGKEDKHEAKTLSFTSIFIGCFFACIVAILYFTIPKILIGFYIDVANPMNIKIIHMATILIMIAAFSQIFDAIRNAATGALRGYYDTKTPMWLGILSTWIISLPLGYLLAFSFHIGPAGLRLGFLFGFGIGAILVMRRLLSRIKLEQS